MLSETLEKSMEKSMRYERITKASKYSKISNVSKKEKSPEKEYLMLQKVSKFVKKESPEVEIKIIEKEKETKLPFFKSIEFKLSEAFCA